MPFTLGHAHVNADVSQICNTIENTHKHIVPILVVKGTITHIPLAL